MLFASRLLLLWSLLAGSSVTPNPPWKGLPLRTTVHSGQLGDPINLAFEGTRDTILHAFALIHWVKADPLSIKNDLHLAEAALTKKPYLTAPVSNLYLLGRPEDFAVEHEIGTIAQRDHARLWDTGRQDATTHLELWLSDVSRDIAVKVLMRHHLPVGTTHRIDGNLDAERSLVVSSLQQAGLVAAVVMEPGMGRTTTAVNAGGDHFSTDGRVALIVLK